jgi:Tol biopolymer transport system component
VALVALLAVAGAGWLTRGGGAGAGEVGPVTFEIEVAPADMWVSSFPPSRVSLHPDGQTVYMTGLGPTGVMEVFARRLDALELTRLLPEREAGSPSVSPDGRLLAAIFEDGLRIVDLADGTVRDVTLEGGAQGIPLWDDSGNIFMIAGSGDMVRIGGRSLAMDTLYRPSQERRDRGLSFDALPLPGGRFVLLSPSGQDPGTNDVEALDLETGETRPLLTAAAYPVYLPFGVLTYLTPEGRIEGVRFDPETATLEGEPVTLLDGVRYEGNSVRSYSVSPLGTLAYETQWRTRNHLVWVELDGSERRVDADLPMAPGDVTFSPDGRHLAFGAGLPPFEDVYVHDFAQDLTSRLTTSRASDTRPSWMPDGRVAFVSDREGPDGVRTRAIYAVPVDGSARPSLVVKTERFVQQASWRPDGLMIFREGYSDGGTMRDIFLRSPGDTVNRPFLVDSRDEHSPEFSPDGQWVVYASAERGDAESRIYVRALDGSGGRIPISAEPAISPLWAPDGRSLYYRSASGMLVQAVLDWSSGRPTVVERRPLFSVDNYLRDPVDRTHDIHPDGDRFIFVKMPPSTRIVVVTDWFSKVREALGMEG